MNANSITLSEAIQITSTYQNETQFSGQPKACYISKSNLMDLLGQNDCDGVRIYFSLNETDQLGLVIVGTSNGGDTDLTNGELLGNLAPCPMYCAANSPL
jgi:hypothetical protein